jgi:hypothetical protein
MAVRAEQFPFSINPFAWCLALPSAAWSALLSATGRLLHATHPPMMGSMSSEWLRDHASDTSHSWD